MPLDLPICSAQLEGVYVGQLKGDRDAQYMRHGFGTYTFASGAKYEGEWKNGKKHGQGTYTRANGTIYHSGEWVNNETIEKFRVSLRFVGIRLDILDYIFLNDLPLI